MTQDASFDRVANLLVRIYRKVRIRSLPPTEFDAIVDGKLARLKLVQRSSGRGTITGCNFPAVVV
jgi:hypothetical protein